MNLQEKINSDFGLWQLHLGARKPHGYKAKQNTVAGIEERDKPSVRNSRSPEYGIFRRMVTEILKNHGTDSKALKVYTIIKQHYDYQGYCDIHRVANTLSVARYDILNNITDEKIIELYKNNSTREVGRILGICSVSVQDRLLQNNVKLRNRSESKLLSDKKRWESLK